MANEIVISPQKLKEIKISTLKSSIGLSTQIVEELPANPSSKVQYLIPNPDGDSANAHDVYMYIDNEWLLLGSTYIDPQKYYTKTEADDKFIEQIEKGQPNGIATLGADGQVPASQLPIWNLHVYQEEITVGAKTGVENIFISTNTDWTVACDADWIYLSHTSGENCAMIQVRYDYNDTGQDRTATITVLNNGQQNGITFNQIKALPTSVNLSADGDVRLTTDNNIRV